MTFKGIFKVSSHRLYGVQCFGNRSDCVRGVRINARGAVKSGAWINSTSTTLRYDVCRHDFTTSRYDVNMYNNNVQTASSTNMLYKSYVVAIYVRIFGAFLANMRYRVT